MVMDQKLRLAMLCAGALLLVSWGPNAFTLPAGSPRTAEPQSVQATTGSSRPSAAQGGQTYLAQGAAAVALLALASGACKRSGRASAVACRVKVGQRVQWHGKSGTVQYVGEVTFADGEYAGVQLDDPAGMHDGTVFNKSYFSCPPKHGIFCERYTLREMQGMGAVSPPAAPAAPTPVASTGSSFTVGQQVTYNGQPATVRFCGKTNFSSDEMVGLELATPTGMHDGSLFGKTYFTCADKHGVFAMPSALR
mmetsp:Transcript_58332/g.139046  ORF Transcript_58332/g.139046 Transcript_58332/m.139046 type:complete len:251 (-) Transcript_58332:281-1033(-)